MKLIDLSIMEVRILKHLYCQNPNRNYDNPKERFKYQHGLELTSNTGMKLRLFLTSIRSGSDLRRRINPGVCIPGGTLNFIHSQLAEPRIEDGSRQVMPETFKRAYHDAVRALVSRQLVEGFVAGYEIAVSEDGFRAPVPARWLGDEHERIVAVSLTRSGFQAARELFMQLAEEGD